MATPVVIVEKFGVPVTIAPEGFGTPLVEATNGFGIPVVVKPSGGLPVSGLLPLVEKLTGGFADGVGGFQGTPTWIKVTTLADSGAGSLREAIDASGDRVIVFEVGGQINLESDLSVDNGNVTILGQTAPSPGISLYFRRLFIRASNVVIEHIRIRPGDVHHDGTPVLAAEAENRDAILLGTSAVRPVQNVLIKNCSFSWSMDEMLSFWFNCEDVTVRECIFAEPLADTTHPDTTGGIPHNYNFLIASDATGPGAYRIAVIANLFAHGDRRNPRLNDRVTAVVLNNVIYNCGTAAIHLQGPDTFNANPTVATVIGNNLKAGPNTPGTQTTIESTLSIAEDGAGRLYHRDNTASAGHVGGFSEQGSGAFPLTILGSAEITDGSLIELTADERDEVMEFYVGSRPRDRDSADARVISDYLAGTGGWIDSQTEVGGYPALISSERTLDPPAAVIADGPAWVQQYTDEVMIIGGTVEVPAQVFDFSTAALPAGVSVARATVGTRFDASRIVEEIAVDLPRFDHDPVTGAYEGILFEPALTPAIATRDFTTGISVFRGSMSITNDPAQLSCDGSNSAEFFKEDGTLNDTHHWVEIAAMPPNQLNTVLMVAKGSGRDAKPFLRRQSAVQGHNFEWNLNTDGTIGAISEQGSPPTDGLVIEAFALPNGLHLARMTCNVTQVIGDTNTQLNYQLSIDTDNTYDGDNVSGNWIDWLMMYEGEHMYSLSEGARSSDQLEFTVPSGPATWDLVLETVQGPFWLDAQTPVAGEVIVTPEDVPGMVELNGRHVTRVTATPTPSAHTEDPNEAPLDNLTNVTASASIVPLARFTKWGLPATPVNAYRGCCLIDLDGGRTFFAPLDHDKVRIIDNFTEEVVLDSDLGLDLSAVHKFAPPVRSRINGRTYAAPYDLMQALVFNEADDTARLEDWSIDFATLCPTGDGFGAGFEMSDGTIYFPAASAQCACLKIVPNANGTEVATIENYGLADLTDTFKWSCGAPSPDGATAMFFSRSSLTFVDVNHSAQTAVRTTLGGVVPGGANKYEGSVLARDQDGGWSQFIIPRGKSAIAVLHWADKTLEIWTPGGLIGGDQYYGGRPLPDGSILCGFGNATSFLQIRPIDRTISLPTFDLELGTPSSDTFGMVLTPNGKIIVCEEDMRKSIIMHGYVPENFNVGALLSEFVNHY